MSLCLAPRRPLVPMPFTDDTARREKRNIADFMVIEVLYFKSFASLLIVVKVRFLLKRYPVGFSRSNRLAKE